ncbi:GSCOCG00012395001-RA-CDS, partial [Cotesia congregata]
DADSSLRYNSSRKAPSLRMGSIAHLLSPSDLGFLPPGLMSKSRFDDGSNHINSPRLYEQPTAESNHRITLNTVKILCFFWDSQKGSYESCSKKNRTISVFNNSVYI